MASGSIFSSAARSLNVTLFQRGQRAIILMSLTTVLFTVCGVRLAQLQLVEGDQQRQLAENNRIRLMPIASDRGNITDRQGRLLASNHLTRSLYLWPREQTLQQWQQIAAQLGPILGITPQEILSKLERVGYKSSTPVRIGQRLTPTTFVAIAERTTALPGVEIRAEATRYYPNGQLGAHVLGYIGEATAEDMQSNPDWPMGIIVGQLGVERIAEHELQGTWGNRLIEVNAGGQELRMLGTKPSRSGSTVQLTLDMDLQKTAEKGLAGRRGAVVVLDVKTGAVLALASSPTFDPNLFTRKISQSDWQKLQASDKPFLNRALQGYPPGSTFKPITAIAGMQSGKFTPDSTLGTAAFISLGGFQFWEHGGGGYGVIGFREALAVSSNTFFYQVGLEVGPEQISKWARKMGIGNITDLPLDGGSHGMVPTPEEKQKLFGEPWYAGDTVSTSIGQGLVQATPLELAVVYAAIANGGWRVKPHLLTSQTNTSATQREATGIDPAALAAVKSGLIAVVQEGTARQLNDGSIPLTAGKTGTAEVLGQEDNAMYAGYGPADKPEIALAVAVENGGYGAVSAVPIAHEIYKTYFNSRKIKGPNPSK